MKRIITFLIVAAMCFALAACSNHEAQGIDKELHIRIMNEVESVYGLGLSYYYNDVPVLSTGMKQWFLLFMVFSFIGWVSVTPLICFVIAVFVATAAELLTSYLMEFVIGEWLWDYTNDIPNFQGRIALKSSLRFGIMGILGLC